MHPHDMKKDWSAIEKRLTREFGPLERFGHVGHSAETLLARAQYAIENPGTFDRAWIVEVDRRFHWGDDVAGHHALARWHAPDWFLTKFDEAGMDAADGGEVATSGTFEEAVAYLYSCCRGASVFPDNISLNIGEQRLVLRLHGERFATVERLKFAAPAASDNWLRRAKSTLIGFRRAEDPDRELARRIAQWPGLKSIEGAVRPTGDDRREVVPDNGICPHLSVPSEWLFSAKTLLEGAGLDSSIAEQQRFVAAYFGAPSYNHLVGGVAERCASMQGPWDVEISNTGSVGEHIFFADPYEAFCTFAKRLASAVGNWADPNLQTSAWGNRGLEVVASYGKAGDGTVISMRALRPAFIDNDDASLVMAVETALQQPGMGLLTELFMGTTTGVERSLATLEGCRLIVTHQEGAILYAFYLFPNGEALGCTRFAKNGNAIRTARGAPLYKGTLVYEAQIDAWVLFADYKCSHAVDAFQTLPPETVSAVSILLEASGTILNQGGRISQTDRMEVARILEEDRELQARQR